MNKETAAEVLTQAINAGVIKGIYSLKDVETILEAIKVLSIDKK
jgi:hypothetical protein